MKTRVILVVLATALVLALLAPAALAATDSYARYGSNIRATYGSSLGQTSVNSPASYGVQINQSRAFTSQSYGVRLGHKRVLPTETYGSQLANPTGNPNVVPYLYGTGTPRQNVW